MTTAEEAGRWTIHPERDTTVPWRAKKSTMLIARPRLLWRDGAHNEDQGEAQRAEFPSPGRRGERQTYTTLLHPVRTTPLTVSSHHSAHAPKAPNRVVCIFYFSVRVTPKPRWSNNNNNRDNDNNCKNSDNCDSLRPGGQRGRPWHAQRPQLQRTFEPRRTNMLRTDSPPATSTVTLNTIGTAATWPTTRHRQKQERRPRPRSERSGSNKRARRTRC